MNAPEFLNKSPNDLLAQTAFPLLEIDLRGNLSFEKLLSVIYSDFKIPYKLVHVDIEYFGKSNFGKVLIHLMGNTEENQKVIQYFDQHNIQNTLKGYA